MKTTVTPAVVTPATFPALFIDDATDAVWLIRTHRPEMQEAMSFQGVLIHHPSVAASIGMRMEFTNLCNMSRFTGSITLENDK